MSGPNIICLAIDRLHVGYFGAYGNTWISTPAMDRLASQSLVLDRMMIDSPSLEELYHSLWRGHHALVPESRIREAEPLPARLARAGWQSTLLTDDPTLAAHSMSDSFGRRFYAMQDGRYQTDEQFVVDDVEDTDAAAFFTKAIDWLENSPPQPFLLWAHTGTLGRIWDAPLAFRAQYHDEDDPPPDSWAAVPNRMLTGEIDPDELLGMRHAYAGQVSLIDQLLGSLVEILDQLPIAADTMLVVLSTRGFPLAEHGRIGICDDALYAELAHVPCLFRLPRGGGAGQRSRALIQPADICATLLDFAIASQAGAANLEAGSGRSILPLIGGEPATMFDRACAISHRNEFRIETPAWAMRTSSGSQEFSQKRTELFVKPDDWCEVNEVSDRCPEAVDQLQIVLAEFRRACEAGEPCSSPALSEDLISGVD